MSAYHPTSQFKPGHLASFDVTLHLTAAGLANGTKTKRAAKALTSIKAPALAWFASHVEIAEPGEVRTVRAFVERFNPEDCFADGHGM